MRHSRLTAALGGLIFLLSSVVAICQDQEMHSWSSKHYRVLSDTSVTRAMEIAGKLEASLSLYNEFLHYDTDSLEHTMRVRIFSEKTDYDRYLNRLISETRSDFVYMDSYSFFPPSCPRLRCG